MYEKTIMQSLLKTISVVVCLSVVQPLFAETKQPDNIIQCFSCFLKKFSDWTWDQEKRLGKREDPKYVICRRYKRVQAKRFLLPVYR